jgi:hypothetical protein
VLTGETPAHSKATVEEAKAFAAGIDTDTPQIALPASVETQIETQSKPYTAAAFIHFKPTGSLKLHRAYHAAFELNAFTVDFEADYESGDLTIAVKRVRIPENGSIEFVFERRRWVPAHHVARRCTVACVGRRR